MTRFAKALVDAGRSVPVNTELDIHGLLPSSTAIQDGVQRLSGREQERFRVSELETVIRRGGGVTSDRLKQNVHVEKYYEFTVHSFQLGKPEILTRSRSVKLASNFFETLPRC